MNDNRKNGVPFLGEFWGLRKELDAQTLYEGGSCGNSMVIEFNLWTCFQIESGIRSAGELKGPLETVLNFTETYENNTDIHNQIETLVSYLPSINFAVFRI